jgi:Trk-type K+ transport system membrane component
VIRRPGRALTLDAQYHILSQLICFIIIAPYMAQGKWKSDFQPPALHKPVSSPWSGLSMTSTQRANSNRLARYSMFQVVSAYTNTGMSLVDTSLVPFQRAYTLLFPLIFLVLAGNTAFVSTTIVA